MRRTTIAFALGLVPAVVAAQEPAPRTTPEPPPIGSAEAPPSPVFPGSYSEENRTLLERAFAEARARHLPAQPVRDRITEGLARGASESQIVVAARHMVARLGLAQMILMRAGRIDATEVEIAATESAMMRGATETQVETIVRHVPADRSLTVPFTAVSDLVARGRTMSAAVAQVVTALETNATDEAIGQLPSKPAKAKRP